MTLTMPVYLRADGSVQPQGPLNSLRNTDDVERACKSGKTVHVSDGGILVLMDGTVCANADAIGVDTTGKYLFVLNTEAAGWKTVADMWNPKPKNNFASRWLC